MFSLCRVSKNNKKTPTPNVPGTAAQASANTVIQPRPVVTENNDNRYKIILRITATSFHVFFALGFFFILKKWQEFFFHKVEGNNVYAQIALKTNFEAHPSSKNYIVKC
jgi:hypothetical protein